MRPRRLVLLAPALVAVLAGCGGSGGSGGADGPGASGPVGDVVATVASVPEGAVGTAVVADSEVPEAVIGQVGAADGLALVAGTSAEGATMAELDPTVDAALALDPDALVYAGGTNDLPAGPTVMLEGLTSRLERWSADRCVVVAVPVFRFRGTTDEAIAEETAGTRILEQAVADAGAVPVSYLDLALEMRAEGQDFFAEGELGDLHPGPAAHPRIAAALVEAVRACPAR